MTCRVLSQARMRESITSVHPGKFEVIKPLVKASRASDNQGRADSSTPWLASEQLFGDNVEVEIHHGTSVYRLRKTSLGKLILTK